MGNWLDQKESASPLKKVRYIIAVAAGKGGVGKSTLSVNLALSLKKKGYSVGLLDADIYGPSLAKMLPAETEIRNCPRDPSLLMPFESKGIKAMSISYLRPASDPMSVRAPIVNNLILQFLFQVEWGELDYLIIDMPPGTGDIQLTIMQKVDISGALIVTTPQSVALADVRKAVQMFNQMNVPILGVVENMSHFVEPISKIVYYPLGKGGGEKLSTEFGMPFLGEIPLDGQISAASDLGHSLFESSFFSPAVQSYEKISGHLLDHLYALERSEKEALKDFELIWELNRHAIK
ncbi:MAG: Mrp/NBP35 family ATP-binding protein [Chlamydiae bacterium]|nr:Mrp/NBP35 family ATP-binding protein [Chlamydiota bacterium]